MKVTGLVLLCGALCACPEERAQPVANPIPVPVTVPQRWPPPPPPARPAPVVVRRVAPRVLTQAEESTVGTWVATTDARASRSKLAAGSRLLALPAGKDLVDGVTEALARDASVPTSCVWLEFFDDLSGFRTECALFNGEPSALDKTDPLTGQKSPFGVAFHWSMPDGKAVRVEFDEALELPEPDGAKKFRSWSLKLSGPPHGEHQPVDETFPELGKVTRRYDWELFPGKFLGK